MTALSKWWKTLFLYTLFIIVWGAFVRASGSGDGCGPNWPSCHGKMFLPNSSIQTLIEYIHRASSGLYGLFVLGVVIATLILRKRYKFTSKLSLILPLLVLFLTVFEALIGAKLVLSGLVGANASWSRALIMIIHLVNTFILIGSIIGCVFLFSASKTSVTTESLEKGAYLANTVLLIFVAALGALTALGDTLYPAESIHHGITQDFALGSPWILRLRVFHPVLAVLTVFSITYFCYDSLKTKLIKHFVIFAYIVLGLGLVNLVLLAPVYMQLIHLLCAQILWSYHCIIGFHLFFPDLKKLV